MYVYSIITFIYIYIFFFSFFFFKCHILGGASRTVVDGNGTTMTWNLSEAVEGMFPGLGGNAVPDTEDDDPDAEDDDV
jgi:hypothetical protein